MLNKGKDNICAICKGSRRLCGKPLCPILERFKVQVRALSRLESRELYGATPPSLLVGEHGYPEIRVGVNIPPEIGPQARSYDDPEGWWGRKGLKDIIGLRASMVYSSFRLNVRKAARGGDKLLERMREAALSEAPVEGEATLKRRPRPLLSFDGILAPIGPRAELLEWDISSNPRVPRRVEKVVSDTDLRALEASYLLFEGGISVYHITRLFSLGLLGRGKDRRLVPTRWAITAVDKLISDTLVKRIRDFKEYPRLELRFAEYIGNRYAILIIPGPWSHEMIEIWEPNSIWVKGREPCVFTINEGTKGLVRGPMDGGYYAIRFAVAEWLTRLRRQATVVVFREVTPDYYAPVGSWQIRESVRRALGGEGKSFESLDQALKALQTKLQAPLKLLLAKSELLKSQRLDLKLTYFIS